MLWTTHTLFEFDLEIYLSCQCSGLALVLHLQGTKGEGKAFLVLVLFPFRLLSSQLTTVTLGGLGGTSLYGGFAALCAFCT